MIPYFPSPPARKAGIAYCFSIFVTLLTHIIIIKSNSGKAVATGHAMLINQHLNWLKTIHF